MIAGHLFQLVLVNHLDGYLFTSEHVPGRLDHGEVAFAQRPFQVVHARDVAAIVLGRFHRFRLPDHAAAVLHSTSVWLRLDGGCSRLSRTKSSSGSTSVVCPRNKHNFVVVGARGLRLPATYELRLSSPRQAATSVEGIRGGTPTSQVRIVSLGTSTTTTTIITLP